MRTRNLYAEIAEGFVALSQARIGNQTLRANSELIFKPTNAEPHAAELDKNVEVSLRESPDTVERLSKSRVLEAIVLTS